MFLEIVVFAEGPTEEQFIKRIVAPALRHLDIFIKPQTLKTSKDASGGAVTFDRLKFNARNTLRQYPNAVLTTFIDLYKLDTDFPKFFESSKKPDVYQKVYSLEAALHDEIVEYVGCRPERFIAHIQPHEYEGLLFSDVDALVNTDPNWSNFRAKLLEIRNDAESPEHINNGYDTKPSKRLETELSPKYKKTLHGPLAAEKITLSTMERECRHFREWMEKLRSINI
jgi:hypothetical protein